MRLRVWGLGLGFRFRVLGFIQNGRCLFAVALFMLALIGLKKFRSFQKPSRIARTHDV